MARFLALDGDSNQIQLLSANIRGDSIRFDKAVYWDEDQPVSALNAAAIGGRLREQLKSAGIAAAPLLVCVGRDRVVVKEIRIPAVPEHEEPAVVRFQAMKEFTDGGDEIVLDYAPMGDAGGGQRRVQVVSVRRGLLNAYKALADAAGLRFAAMTPRPFALVAGLDHAVRSGLVPAAQPADASVALLARGSKWGEFIIVRRGVIAMSRSVAGPTLSSDASLIGEMRRNLALYANQNPNDPVRAIYLPEADSPGGLRDRLQSTLEIPVHAYEPVVGVSVPDGPTGSLAGLGGMFALRSARTADINFVNRREPKPPQDPNKRFLLWAALIALLFLGLVFGIAFLRVSARENQVANKRRQATQTQQSLQSFASEEKQVEAFNQWEASSINWLDELYEFTARAKDHDRDQENIRILQIIANPIEDRSGKKNANKANEPVASMTVRGIMSTRSGPLSAFTGDMAREESIYKVGAVQTKPNRLIDRQKFPQEFSVRIEVRNRPTEKYSRTFVASIPERRPRPSATPTGGRPNDPAGRFNRPNFNLGPRDGGRP